MYAAATIGNAYQAVRCGAAAASEALRSPAGSAADHGQALIAMITASAATAMIARRSTGTTWDS
jgi:hypothetical protein